MRSFKKKYARADYVKRRIHIRFTSVKVNNFDCFGHSSFHSDAIGTICIFLFGIVATTVRHQKSIESGSQGNVILRCIITQKKYIDSVVGILRFAYSKSGRESTVSILSVSIINVLIDKLMQSENFDRRCFPDT